MLPEEKASKILHILLPIFIAIFSVCILSVKVPEMRFMKETINSIEESNDTVLRFTGATLATSVAITLLPDDIATPLADSLADMNKYFVLIMMVLFLEKLIATEGTKIAFLYLIPIACGSYVVGLLIHKNIFRTLAYKLLIFAVALNLVIPCSTHLVNFVCADYIDYVNQTISETEDGSEKINEIMTTTDDDSSVLEKISGAFKNALNGIEDMLSYFKNMIKKCMNSIAILLMTTIAVPVIVLFIFKWLLTELFKIKIPMPNWNRSLPDNKIE